jgi:hypothetical protein
MKQMSQMDLVDDAAWHARYEAISKEADKILAAEGAFRVNGIDYESADDATTARMYAAERRVVGAREP